MTFIDTHCHLHDQEFFTPAEQTEILEKCQKAGVEELICIGTSHEDSLIARDFAEKNENVFWAYGVHPSELYDHTLEMSPSGSMEKGNLAIEASEKKPVAIGEVGLEYHYYQDNHDAQIRLLNEMIQLAVNNDLPLIFHVREGFDDFFPIVDNFHGLRGVVHSFSDNKKNLRKILERDFYVGVNGMATYSTLPLPPLERTLLETDAPFLAPVPHRGEKNSSAFIPDVARFLAEKHGVGIKEVAKITTENAERVFRLG